LLTRIGCASSELAQLSNSKLDCPL
jgi:hypothetical protein